MLSMKSMCPLSTSTTRSEVLVKIGCKSVFISHKVLKTVSKQMLENVTLLSRSLLLLLHASKWTIFLMSEWKLRSKNLVEHHIGKTTRHRAVLSKYKLPSRILLRTRTLLTKWIGILLLFSCIICWLLLLLLCQILLVIFIDKLYKGTSTVFTSDS